jgi:CheY-like chemotaxis protein
MRAKELNLLPEQLELLLLRYKYHTAIRRVARGVSHNYNNIFTGLGGQTAMLQQASALPCDPSGKRAELIDNLLQRGIAQTAVLYDFARDAETESRSHSPLLPAAKALELLNSLSRVHRFVLKSDIYRERLVCNLRDLVLILFYLGENCVDATPEGGEIHLEIVRRVHEPEHPGAEIVFCFRDHGPGFTEDIFLPIDAPFVTTRTDSSFRGLGLYAAGILAAKHHGRLLADRSDSNETVVCAVFPEDRTDVVEQPLPPPRPAGSEGTNGLELQCFLVVEDDEAMRTLLLDRLQRRGHMVFCADTCSEALAEYEHLYDIITIILMDVGLRDTSGFECRRKLLTVNPKARVIFMSGQCDALPPGNGKPIPFLQKPFTLDQLEKAVQDVNV